MDGSSPAQHIFNNNIIILKNILKKKQTYTVRYGSDIKNIRIPMKHEKKNFKNNPKKNVFDFYAYG